MSLRQTRIWIPFVFLGLTFTAGRLGAQTTPRDKAGSSEVYTAAQVTKSATPAPGNPAPKYPFVLQQAAMEGEVRAAFVVDETGKPDTSTFKVIESTHALFARAVRTVLPSMRFTPAERNGRKVKELVEMPFKFTLQ